MSIRESWDAGEPGAGSAYRAGAQQPPGRRPRARAVAVPRARLAPLVALLAALLGVALLTTLAAPAHAVEDEIPDPDALEEEELPDFEELCAEDRVGAEFCPEAYEQPSWFQWLIYPLLIVGLVMVTVMLVAYLTWQPRFAREREEKLKSRR